MKEAVDVTLEFEVVRSTVVSYDLCARDSVRVSEISHCSNVFHPYGLDTLVLSELAMIDGDFVLMEDGSRLDLEDSQNILLETANIVLATEDGQNIIFEDGITMLME